MLCYRSAELESCGEFVCDRSRARVHARNDRVECQSCVRSSDDDTRCAIAVDALRFPRATLRRQKNQSVPSHGRDDSVCVRRNVYRDARREHAFEIIFRGDGVKRDKKNKKKNFREFINGFSIPFA